MIENALAILLRQHAGSSCDVVPSTDAGETDAGKYRLAYTRIGAPRTLTNSGPTRVTTARYQLDAFTPQATQGRAIVNAIVTALHGYGPATVDGTKILLIRCDDDSFGATGAGEGVNNAASKFSQDIHVTYRE